jgi:alkanesulfonate monooxygenase SsuD/methylene tetrahydromethanopterin reductase-like flavin-dependent oxidoreductase (luciferase family)
MTRISQLAEAIQIIRKIWLEDKASFEGQHYTIKELVSFPKPVQKPHPTIWVGTMYGKEHMLKVAAKYGDGINLAWAFTPDRLRNIFEKLDGYRIKSGYKDGVKKSVGFWTHVFEDESEMESAIQEGAKKRSLSIEDYRRRISSSLWGTPEELAEKLTAYEELGVSHAIFMFPHGEETTQAEIFGKQVIPRLK